MSATITPTVAREKFGLTAGDLKGVPKPYPLVQVESIAIKKYGSAEAIKAEAARRTEERLSKKRKREADKAHQVRRQDHRMILILPCSICGPFQTFDRTLPHSQIPTSRRLECVSHGKPAPPVCTDQPERPHKSPPTGCAARSATSAACCRASNDAGRWRLLLALLCAVLVSLD